jgi:Rhs element Vgr protein
MSAASLVNEFSALASAFAGERRLYDLEGEGALGGLLVEAWSLREALSRPWELHLSVLGSRADLDVHAMLGARASLLTTLADGTRFPRSGLVTRASAEEGDGGFARYRLLVEPWLGLLAHTRRSQVWQERSLVEIIESVFARHAEHAAWSWAADTLAHLEASPFSNADGVRSYTVQYRESDLAFVERLLAEEGLVYRFEADDGAPLGHRLVIFAQSDAAESCPADRCSQSALGGAGIRFHRASSTEVQDAVQAIGRQRRLQPATSTVLAWDYKAKRSVATSVPTAGVIGGANAPRLERYDPSSPYRHASGFHAERAARLQQEALEARGSTVLGQGSVRSFSVGTRFTLTQSPLAGLATASGAVTSAAANVGRPGAAGSAPSGTASVGRADAQSGAASAADAAGHPSFVLTAVVHAGINNLPKAPSTELARRRPGQDGRDVFEPWVDDALREAAARSGYANRFDAVGAETPWRPALDDADGRPLHAKPLVVGSLGATVVDAAGQSRSAEEIHTDALGRVRIQFDFQRLNDGAQGPGTSPSSTWVRVLQRYAGAGHGLQFIPRLGQEVLVTFLEGDIDRPLVVGALYNGRGEAGIPATPGGRGAEADTRAFAQSSDHAPSAQGNESGGSSPAWHGASPGEHAAGGQRNAGALSGIKSREFGAAGFNQLVFDDSPGQLRTQLATTQHASQLNLGHLIHQADNHRGSFRGLGFELRSDAYGVVRGKGGLLLTSYATAADEPAGDNAAGIALAGQLKGLAAQLSQAAKTHETVALAAHIGTAGQAKSVLDDKRAPLEALHTALKGMVSSRSQAEAEVDAAARTTATADDKVPHLGAAVVAISAKAGLGVVAAEDIHLAAGEGLTLASGGDASWAIGGAARLHTGQAIGILGGATKPGTGAAGTGLTVVAAKGDIELAGAGRRAHRVGEASCRDPYRSGADRWAAPRRSRSPPQPAPTITIEGGNITVRDPGKIMVKAG